MIKDKIKQWIEHLPNVKRLKQKLSFYEESLLVPPGHFYSPVVNIEEIKQDRQEIFDFNKPIRGIELNYAEQMNLLQTFIQYYSQIPFTDDATPANRYYFNNEAYLYSDAIFLYSIIRHFKPKRIIEIGSGYSSAAILDINEFFFDNTIDLTFIEPYPQVLEKLRKSTDKITLIEKRLQEVNKDIFLSLVENDILFIDSTHVVKTNSDVLIEIFEILPLLNKGVKIHFHDIFYPFEYPPEWVIDQKRNWNEIYLMRAFLMHNDNYKIIAFNTFLEHVNEKWFLEHMPLCLKNRGGSIWLEKIG